MRRTRCKRPRAAGTRCIKDLLLTMLVLLQVNASNAVVEMEIIETDSQHLGTYNPLEHRTPRELGYLTNFQSSRVPGTSTNTYITRSSSKSSKGKGGSGAGVLSSGLYGSQSSYASALNDDSEEVPTSSTYHSVGSNGGYVTTNTNPYYGAIGRGRFQGSFPVVCRPRGQGQGNLGTNGLGKTAKKGKKGMKRGQKDSTYPAPVETNDHNTYKYSSNYKYSTNYKYSEGQGKGNSYIYRERAYSKGSSKGRSSKSKSKSKSKSRGSGKGNEEEGGYPFTYQYGSSNRRAYQGRARQTPETTQTPSLQGFLSRAKFSHLVRRGHRGKKTRFVKRQDILEYECYFGAFPAFNGIPDTLPTQPLTIMPSISQQPTGQPSTVPSPSPTIATKAPTIAPTMMTASPTIAPTAMTAAPTIMTAAPTMATAAPTMATAAPTMATAAPTVATAAPTMATAAPTAATAAPTIATAAPTVATAAPTAATAAPTVATSAPTMATAAPTVATAAPTVATAAPTAATAAPTMATAAPTVSTAAPTVATASPTVATAAPTNATAAPTNATSSPTSAPTVGGTVVDGAQQVLESLLDYGFFMDAILRPPTEAEISSLVNNTAAFYTELMMEAYGGDFRRFNLSLNDAIWDSAIANMSGTVNDTLPFKLDFDAQVTFASNVTQIPTPNDLFIVMQATDSRYQSYIQNYVWKDGQGTLFYEVMRVVFTAKAGQFRTIVDADSHNRGKPRT